MLELVRVKPDLIVLDWTLDDIKPWDEDDPDTMATLRARGQKAISGLEVLRVVKRSTFKTTPVIMLTGHKGFHEKLLGKLLRADKYLTKPLDETAFVQTVHALVPPVSAARRALTGARAAHNPGERRSGGAGRAAALIENT